MCDSTSKYFTSAEVASALGVGESSVKRWIDAGKLTAEKTPGGHRRVNLRELYGFLVATGRKLVDPEAIGLKDLDGQASLKDPVEICSRSLQSGDSFTFESMLQLQRISKDSRGTIIDRILYPAFKKLRDSCQHPSEECMILHRAILMIHAALRITMAPVEKSPEPSSPRIVLADIGYDVDGLPTLLAEAVVWDRAHCLQLGTNVPAIVVEGSLEAFSADILWLSASGPVKKRKIQSEWSSILETAERLKIKIVTFGDAVPPHALGLDETLITSFGEFRGFVTALAGIKRENSQSTSSEV